MRTPAAHPLPRKPTPLRFKSDFDEAARRWEAYFAGEIIDRLLVCVTAPVEGKPTARATTYYERVHGNMDDIIERALISAEATYYGGKAMSSFWLSFGCDEIAAFCVAELIWTEDSGDACWSEPFVREWEQSLPLRLQEDNLLWQRMLSFYRKAAKRMAGKMLLKPLDLHTNMDLLAAVRGPERLCTDLIDSPEMIDLAEEEATIVNHALYHWDGPDALVHTADLLASRGLHTLSYVTGHGHGTHVVYVDLFKRIQTGGKEVNVGGRPDEVKQMHRELKAERIIYWTSASSVKEAEYLLKWFAWNT